MLKIKDNDIIIVQYPRETYGTQEINAITKEMRKIISNPILFLPKDIDISILAQEGRNQFI